MVRAEQPAVFAIWVLARNVSAVERRLGSISALGRPRLPVRTVFANVMAGSSNGSLEACLA